jgi:serine/threonine protein kinase
MMQDSHSALWMGTIDDVLRFEGEHFYSPRPYGFPKETPNSFAEDSDGAIWIATGAPFLAMEFVHGESLRDRLEQGALPRKQIAALLLQIAGALQLLHRSMIYRRDLKPENLMIRINDGRDQQIVFIDFSIATVKSPDQTFHGISRVAGTLVYMAPEQVIGYADAGTDIYSLAKIVIEMLTGLRWTELFRKRPDHPS